MKASRYNVVMDYKDKKLGFNTMSCALAEVDETFINILTNINDIKYEQLDDIQKEVFDNMKYGGYIIDDEVDELKLLKYRSYNSKFNSRGLGLTIAPLLACNFACPYCYESPKPGVMGEDVISSILKMIEKKAEKSEPISITWYGGEPLLAKDIIFSMSEKIIDICKKNKVDYNAYMVSNGYLVTEDIAKKMKENMISGVQITIDGPPDIHNARRKLRNSSEPTFDKIIENIKILIKAGVEVTIRVNIDKTNVSRLEELMDILASKGLTDCIISLGHVSNYTDSCASIADTCLNTEEYAIESLKNQEVLFEKGFNVSTYPNYPGVKGNYCCADSNTSFVIDFEGYMYKCWNDVGNHSRSVGNVKDIENDEDVDSKQISLNAEYILWSPFDYEECVGCNLLPICMGGCPYNGIKGGHTPKCEKWKYNLIDVLKKTYDERNIQE